MAHPGGRPSKYTPELADRICRAIATSTKSLKQICASNEGFPCRETIYDWCWDYEEFSNKYDQAKRHQANLLAEEVVTIADDDYDDMIQGEHGMIPNSARVQRHKLRVDSRKWIACKLLPKVYGEKQHVESEHKVTFEDKLKDLK